TWRDLLAPYPGNLGELCVGILTFGASIGCLLPPSPRSARNYKIDVPELFSDKIRSDLAQGRIQIVNDPVQVVVSPLGLVPKHDGGWRRIHDLSWPEGKGVNSSIPDEASAISYTSLDEIFNLVRLHGRGCLIIKRDLKEAFRQIPLAIPSRPLIA